MIVLKKYIKYCGNYDKVSIKRFLIENDNLKTIIVANIIMHLKEKDKLSNIQKKLYEWLLTKQIPDTCADAANTAAIAARGGAANDSANVEQRDSEAEEQIRREEARKEAEEQIRREAARKEAEEQIRREAARKEARKEGLKAARKSMETRKRVGPTLNLPKVLSKIELINGTYKNFISECASIEESDMINEKLINDVDFNPELNCTKGEDTIARPLMVLCTPKLKEKLKKNEDNSDFIKGLDKIIGRVKNGKGKISETIIISDDIYSRVDNAKDCIFADTFKKNIENIKARLTRQIEEEEENDRLLKTAINNWDEKQKEKKRIAQEEAEKKERIAQEEFLKKSVEDQYNELIELTPDPDLLPKTTD